MEYLISLDNLMPKFLKLEHGRFFICDAYKFTTTCETKLCIDIKDYLINTARSITQNDEKFKQFKQMYNRITMEDLTSIIDEKEFTRETCSNETLYKIGIILAIQCDTDPEIVDLEINNLLCKIRNLVFFAIVPIHTEQSDESEYCSLENMIEDFESFYVDKLGNLVTEGPNRTKLCDYLKNANSQQKQKLHDQMLAITINEMED